MLGMALDAGGHLTHGFRPNVSGKLFRYCSYGVDPRHRLLDYDEVRGRPAREAAAPDRRLQLVPAADQLPHHPRDRRRGRRDVHGRHGALRRTGRRQGVHRRLRPGAPRAHRDDHDAQDAARPARRPGAVPAGARRDVDRGCPLVLGGPLAHVMAAKAVALAEAAAPSSRPTPRRSSTTPARSPRRWWRGASVVTGGTDNHLVLVDVRAFGLNGRQAEARCGTAGVTLNRNVIPTTPTAPGTQRPAPRHAGGDDARHGRGRDGRRSPR